MSVEAYMKKRIWMIILFLLIGLAGISISNAAAVEDVEPTDVIKPSIAQANTEGITQAVAAPGVTILKNAEWIHGTSANVEYPQYLYRTDRKGWGTTYWGKNNTFNWFHFAIPTTVISNGVRNKIAKTFVLFKTDGNAKIKNVHIYDGPYKIKAYDGLSLSGNHSYKIDSSNAFVINPPRYVY